MGFRGAGSLSLRAVGRGPRVGEQNRPSLLEGGEGVQERGRALGFLTDILMLDAHRLELKPNDEYPGFFDLLQACSCSLHIVVPVDRGASGAGRGGGEREAM
eukprot:270325-Hanusia_phi.AAC.2